MNDKQKPIKKDSERWGARVTEGKFKGRLARVDALKWQLLRAGEKAWW